MTFYPAPNPYRASTGSMPLYVSSTVSSSSTHNHQDSKYEEQCGSCGSSYTDEHLLHMNTPWSTPPNQSSASLQPPASPGHRSRRASASSHEPPKVLTRYPSGALVLEPAISYSYERPRGKSVSSVPEGVASVPRTQQYHHHHHHHHHDKARTSFSKYSGEIDTTTVRGTTKFPRRLVNKDAVRQAGYPFEEDRVTGAITVQLVLGREEVERLVELTEQSRASRQSTTSSESSKQVRIITHPTETFVHKENAPPGVIVTGGRQYYHAHVRHASTGTPYSKPSSSSAHLPLSPSLLGPTYLEPGASRHSTYKREGGHRRSASTSAATSQTIRVGSDGRVIMR